MEYRRVKLPGATYFLTMVTRERQKLFKDAKAIKLLGNALRHVKSKWPYKLDAICVLPEHMHLLMTLPDNTADYSIRVRLIKQHFHHAYIRLHQKPKGLKLWQNRFDEHCIRNDNDYQKHLDYIHYNPVKHGYVSDVNLWPWSSFKRYQKQGLYPKDWGVMIADEIKTMDLE